MKKSPTSVGVELAWKVAESLSDEDLVDRLIEARASNESVLIIDILAAEMTGRGLYI